jgi:hypothetical protein
LLRRYFARLDSFDENETESNRELKVSDEQSRAQHERDADGDDRDEELAHVSLYQNGSASAFPRLSRSIRGRALQPCRRDPSHSSPPGRRISFRNIGSCSRQETIMVALVLLAANMPAMICAVCSTFLACKERSQWVWFAALAVLAGFGGHAPGGAADRSACVSAEVEGSVRVAPGT